MRELMKMYDFEKKLERLGYKYIVGVDEVGRGPLAAGVLAAAVILNPKVIIEGLNDSKQLTEKRRKLLSEEIKQKSLAYAFGYVDENLIDEINIYQASKLAMLRAISYLKITPDYILSDAMPLKEQNLPFEAIIKGDTLSASIAAASIIAKVKRDEIMDKFSVIYPDYGFSKHKGYPTRFHLDMLKKLGPTKIHRKTYKPVKDCLVTQITLENLI
ncbi:MAG: ribonuclease HII [Candidatus Izemoplasmatales bacterium]|nr:ribonuclease HII [Candidatus Izemoplasmatales bacterium]MDD4069915.1 ribonuclease HII [Candidatus Izemoplasmatales bacterium]